MTTATPAHERFVVDNRESAIRKHVVVIDDTWATGARSQSAALVVRSAGAQSVTTLVIARWLNPNDHQPSAQLERSKLTRDYDPCICPVTGQRC